MCIATPTRNIHGAFEIQTPLYSGHAVAVQIVSALKGLHCKYSILTVSTVYSLLFHVEVYMQYE